MNDITTQEEPKSTTEEPQAFDAAFAEFASDTPQPPVQAGDEGEKDPSEQGDADAPAAPSDGTGAATEIADDDAKPAPLSDQAPTDIWAQATPEQKAAFEAAETARRTAEHRLSSDNGRVAALQRQLDEARRSMAAGGSQRTETPKGLKDLMESEEIKAFEREYPEVSAPILNLLRGTQAQLEQLQGTAQLVEQDRTTAFLESQIAAYEHAHPDWRDYASNDQFDPWLKTQPRHIQEAAQRNVQHIVDAAEASDVLSRFKAHIGVGTPTPRADPAPSTATPPVTDARRQRQLDGAVDVRTKGPQATSGAPDEFGAAFVHFANRKR